MLDRPEEYKKMYEVELALWWYQHLHAQVLRALSSVPLSARIADLACGTGGLLYRLREAGFATVQGFDLSEHAISFCTSRGFAAQQCDVRDIDTVIPEASLDVLICNDALCYFTPDEQDQLMQTFLKLLKPSGKIIMNLPALKAFSGMHDKGVGIVHRFSLMDVERLAKDCATYSYRFWPLALAPLIYGRRLWQRAKLHCNPGVDVYSDVELPSKFVNRALYALTSVEMMLPMRWPCASSVFVVGER